MAVLPLAVLVAAAYPAGSVPASASTSVTSTATAGKLVVAAYFPWYGTPSGPTGTWVHWLDSNGNRIIKDHPYALYDSKDPGVMSLQLAMASYVGIDAFAVSWWGAGTNEDQNFGSLLNTAASIGVPVRLAAQFETTGLASGGASGITSQLTYVLRNYAGKASYLRVAGRPVVFIYNPAAFSTNYDLWAAIIASPSIAQYNPFVIVDSFTDDAARVFDGIYTFAPFGPNLPFDPAALYAKYQAACAVARLHGKIFVPAASPGFDDSAVRTPSTIIPRSDYLTYLETWGIARDSQADWIFIDSWNEWHEATELEPSSEYGSSYLYATAILAAYFKAASPAAATLANRVPSSLRSTIQAKVKAIRTVR